MAQDKDRKLIPKNTLHQFLEPRNGEGVCAACGLEVSGLDATGKCLACRLG